MKRTLTETSRKNRTPFPTSRPFAGRMNRPALRLMMGLLLLGLAACEKSSTGPGRGCVYFDCMYSDADAWKIPPSNLIPITPQG